MTAIVNFFGGPGTGKSTNSAALFAELKKRGVNTELAPEYAKDCVWEDRLATLENQLYIFGKQHHRIHRLINKVDIVITDSPLLLSIIYNSATDDRGQNLNALVLSVFREMNNINFFIRRTRPFQALGRIHTEEQSREIDTTIRKLLIENEIPYSIIDPSADVWSVPALADKVMEMADV